MGMLEQIENNDYFKSLNVGADLILDPLTKAISRRYILDYIDYLISKNIPFSLSVLDIDNFKTFNDTMGHQVGDMVLVNVTNLISSQLDENTVVGRYGGDEFLLVSVNNTVYEERHSLHKKIFTAIRQPMNLGDKTVYITMSGGCSLYPKDGKYFDDLFNKADVTLYRAKSKGRNCYVIYDPVKHANIKIEKNESILLRMHRLNSLFAGTEPLHHKIYEALIQISASVGVDGAALFEVGNDPLIYAGTFQSPIVEIPREILEESYQNNMIVVDERKKLDENSSLYKFMSQHEASSCCIAKLMVNRTYLGYLILFNTHVRVWQEVEVASTLYLATIIENIIYFNHK